MTWKSVLSVALALAAWTATGRAAEPSKSAAPPNVVVIVADDLGYADLGVQGAKDIPTPNIDALAKSGVRFTAGYVTCPICAPTRAGLLTGRYQQRYGFDDNNGPAEPDNYGIDSSERTLADSLKAGGYATGVFGKWHVGTRVGYQPLDRGFDEFFGFFPGANSYLHHEADDDDTEAWASMGSTRRARYINGRRSAIVRQRETVDEPEYLTDAFAREASSFIERQAQAGKPFFLYLPFNAVHAPLEATDKYLARFPDLPTGRRTYAAMVSAMDDGVGQVIATLRKTGQADNTIIFFLSDNGGPTADGAGGGNYSLNTPLRGRKATFWEGGVRVPFFVAWPGRLPADKTVDTPVISLDILPTALAATGVKHVGTKPLDGNNLLPLIRGESDAPRHDVLYWRYHAHYAARDAQWKLIRAKGRPPQLFRIDQDISETTDLAAEHPEQVQRLSKLIDEWDAGNERPRWVRTIRSADGGGTEPQPAPITDGK